MTTTNTSSTYQVQYVENPSFETPTLADGAFTAGYSQEEPVPGWKLYDPKGVVTGTPLTPGGTDFTDVGAGNPAMAQYFKVPDGQNEGYSFAVTPGSGMVGFSQTLDVTLTPNTQYTLLVNVGNPAGIDPTMGADYTGFPGYALELGAGNQGLDYTLNPVAVPEGQFSAVAFSFTTPANDPEFPYGEKLQIRLVNLNENPGYEVDFDNVQVVSKPAGNAASLTSTIVNGDFEEPVLADGTFTLEAPTGWQLYNPNGLIPANPTNDSSSVGVSNPTTNNYANKVFSGPNDAFVFLTDNPGSGLAGISQTLDSVLTANTKYTLLVDVGNPKGVDPSSGIDLTGFPGYRVELLAGDTVVAADNNTLQIADGSFATSTLNFTVGADNPLLGQNLGIRLVNLLSGEGTEVDFDGVALRTEQVQDGSQVYINNAGFELPVLSQENPYTSVSRLSNPVSGWNIYDPDGLLAKFRQPDPITGENVSVGVDNYPTPLVYPHGIPEGNNVAYAYTPNYEGAPVSIGEGVVGISQTLDTLLAANTTYTLSVDVGNPESFFSQVADQFFNFDGFPGYEVQLLAGNHVIATDHNSLCLADGDFGTSTVTFTTGSDSSYLGQNLGIRLINLNEGPGTEVDFDNVQLTAHAVTPNPGCGCWC